MTLQQGHAPISRWVFSVQSHPRFRQSGSIGKTFRNVLKTLGQSCNLLAGQQAQAIDGLFQHARIGSKSAICQWRSFLRTLHITTWCWGSCRWYHHGRHFEKVCHRREARHDRGTRYITLIIADVEIQTLNHFTTISWHCSWRPVSIEIAGLTAGKFSFSERANAATPSGSLSWSM